MVIYWDASAILSILVEDSHSKKAIRIEKQDGIHLASTLGVAETFAVLKRMNYENMLPEILYESAFESFEKSVIRKINTQPDWKVLRKLSSKYVLKGADLWHLAAVKTIQTELPEVEILTFDRQLMAAAEKEEVALFEDE